MRLTKLFIFCIFISPLFGQNTRVGVVRDADGAPLAFVSILINNDRDEGFLSDIDGNFSVFSKKEIRSLTFRCVGFELLKLDDLFLNKNSAALDVRLISLAGNLAEAVIRPGENPAHRIVRLAVDNRAKNDPEKLDAFRCQTYQKIVLDFLPDSINFKKALKKVNKRPKTAKKLEKRWKMNVARADTAHIFIMEAATDMAFKFPDQRHEKVLLSRASGFEDAMVSAAGTQMQPFSFSRDFLPLMGLNFRNPISPNSHLKYHLLMEDTLFVGLDTIWTISFYPRKGHAFEGLKGRFSVNSNQYALQNIVVEPNDPKLVEIKLEQSFRFLLDSISGGGHWFPSQMNFDVVARKYPTPYTGLQVLGRARLDSVQFHPDFSTIKFDPLQAISMEKIAMERDSAKWKTHQFDQLDDRDLATYKYVDSIGDRYHFDRAASLMSVMITGVLPIKKSWPIRIDVNKTLLFNQLERARIGVGLTTAPPNNFQKIRSPWLWTGWVGYGIRDKTWKAGSNLRLRIDRASESYINVGTRQDLLAPGQLSPSSGFLGSNFYANQLDDFREGFVAATTRIVPNLFIAGRFSNSLDQPRYDYFYIKNPENAPDTLRQFRLSESSLTCRFTRQRGGQMLLGQPISATSRWPTIQFSWTHGFSGLLGGQFSYDRYELSLSQRTPVRGLGMLDWRVEGGILRGEAPLARSFTINQSSAGGFGLFSFGQSFSRIDTLLLSDRFVNFYFKQTIGTPFWRKKWSKPLISLIQNAAIGDLKSPEKHAGIGFLTPKKGLFESGIRVDDLIRIKYFNLAYIGLGIGVYSRWGELASPKFGENISFRLGINVGI
jgi:Family of unknown function (DUF5686)